MDFDDDGAHHRDMVRWILCSTVALAACGGSHAPLADARCRIYPELFDDEVGQTTKCELSVPDGGPVTLTCTPLAPFVFSSRQTKYDSLADFVAESQFGSLRYRASVLDTIIASTAESRAAGYTHFTSTTAVTYDASRPTVSASSSSTNLVDGGTATGSRTTTFSDWDAKGRPTRGLTDQPHGGGSLIISYDDGARVATRTVSGADGNVVSTSVTTYDENGNWTSSTVHDGETPDGDCCGLTGTMTRTVRQTRQICLPH